MNIEIKSSAFEFNKTFYVKDISESSSRDFIENLLRHSYEQSKFIREISKISQTETNVELDLPTVVILTYGGEVYPGFGMYDVMKKVKVNTIAVGPVMSMGIPLFLAGVKRSCYQNTRFMIHSVSNFTWGKTQEIMETVEELKYIEDQLWECISDNCNITSKELEVVRREKINWFISAKEALKLGIVHEIIK